MDNVGKEIAPIDNKYELKEGVFANLEQRLAIDNISDKVKTPTKTDIVLQGKGGTGKTTIIKKILNELKTSILLVAPSHCAKEVLANATGNNFQTVTLASALGMKLNQYTGKFEVDEWTRRNSGIPIEENNIIVIDECSMIGENSLALIEDMRMRTSKIIYMGDPNQLPPIREKDENRNPDADSPVFNFENKFVLNQRMRQSEDSPIIPITDLIIDNIDKINKKDKPLIHPIPKEKKITEYDSVTKKGIIFTDNVRKALITAVEDFKATDDVYDSKIICYTNEKRRQINNIVRNMLYEEHSDEEYVIDELVTAFDTYSDSENTIYNSENFRVKEIEYDANYYGFQANFLTLERSNGIRVEVPVIHREDRSKFDNRIAVLFKNRQFKDAYSLKEKFAQIEYGYAISSHKS